MSQIHCADSVVKQSRASRSDVFGGIIDAQIGSIPNTGDSVSEVRAIRAKLSNEVPKETDTAAINAFIDEINELGE